MMVGVSSVALVVRLKSTWRCSCARSLIRIVHHLLEQREIHQRLAAEEGDVNGTAARRLLQQKIHRGLGGGEVHELRLALGSSHFVRAEFVAVLARQVALVGEIQHQRLQRKIRGRGLHRLGNGASGDDYVRMRHFGHQLPRVFRF